MSAKQYTLVDALEHTSHLQLCKREKLQPEPQLMNLWYSLALQISAMLRAQKVNSHKQSETNIAQKPYTHTSRFVVLSFEVKSSVVK